MEASKFRRGNDWSYLRLFSRFLFKLKTIKKKDGKRTETEINSGVQRALDLSELKERKRDMSKSVKEIVKVIEAGKDNLRKTFQQLEASGDINSDGEITVKEAIKGVGNSRMECYLFDSSKVYGKYVVIGLVGKNGKSTNSLIVTDNGKLYFSQR